MGRAFGLLAALLTAAAPVVGADLDQARRQLIAGGYEDCIEQASRALDQRKHPVEGWAVLKCEAELATGRLEEARATVEAGLKRAPRSVRLRLLGSHVSAELRDAQAARRYLDGILQLDREASRRTAGMDDLLVLGEARLLTGADPRSVLEEYFIPARRRAPQRREPYLAIGTLALNSRDFELAADVYQAAVQRFPNDADAWFGLALAWALDEPRRSDRALAKVLALNPRHVQALLFRADQLLDADRLDEADALLRRALEVNPREGDAWAYRALLAHLGGDLEAEDRHRAAALECHPGDPTIDYLIGSKLSLRYRFDAGAVYQRRALEIDAGFLPAKVQLCQDLLRLGQETEGWELAHAVNRKDRRNAVVHNLLELRERMTRFRRLENDDFLVRMDAREADLYGDRVLNLLGRAKAVLCARYGVELKEKVIVEIFPEESDFAVRTFGMPGAPGYLGVCFGKVITTNSPASQQDNPANWESVLWHEFCHVVTLELTGNRVPRWLGEGISVYEERQADPAWGLRMTPRYREMVLSGEMTPIGELNGAFLAPDSPEHLEFAYYQSALVVEFLVAHYGFESLTALLGDVGRGLTVNDALERHTAPLAVLDRGFTAFARERAGAMAPQADWRRLDLRRGERLEQWVAWHPTNVPGLKAHARTLLNDGQWERAKAPLRRAIELHPGDTGRHSAYRLLAFAHRQLGETDAERDALEAYVDLDAAAQDALLRLIEIDLEAQDWGAVLDHARRVLAINPLIPQPYRATVLAAESLGQTADAIAACRALLTLQPHDAAQVHYDLARLLHRKNDPAAHAHAVTAVEKAPGFDAARRLLLRIRRDE